MESDFSELEFKGTKWSFHLDSIPNQWAAPARLSELKVIPNYFKKEKDMALSLEQLIKTDWPAVLASHRAQRRFPTPELNFAYENESIQSVEPFDDTPGKTFVITSTFSWSMKTEALSSTANQKISLATALMDNAINVHSEKLLDYIGEDGKKIYIGKGLDFILQDYTLPPSSPEKGLLVKTILFEGDKD